TEIHEDLGHGICGSVAGRRVVVGAPAWVRTRASHGREFDRWIAELVARGETPIAIAVDGAIRAVAGLADPIRPGAAAALSRLSRLGWSIELLSGDEPRVVTAVGAALGIAPTRCHGGISPEAKLAHVQTARALGPVAMVGDGVNDAAAIAA